MLVLHNELSLYSDLFMFYFLFVWRIVLDQRIKGGKAVHTDHMIRSINVNRKQSALYTSPERMRREGTRERETRFFCFLQHAEAIKSVPRGPPFSPPLSFWQLKYSLFKGIMLFRLKKKHTSKHTLCEINIVCIIPNSSET